MLNCAASAATVNQCSVLVVNPYPDRPCVAGSVEGGASSMTAVCLPQLTGRCRAARSDQPDPFRNAFGRAHRVGWLSFGRGVRC